MPRIKLTRCVSSLVIISAISVVTFSLWSEVFKEKSATKLPSTDTKKDGDRIDPESDAERAELKWMLNDEFKLLKSVTPKDLWTKIPIKPWFMKDGYLRPNTFDKIYSSLAIWPEEDPGSDRIANQLMYLPPDYESAKRRRKLKKIYLFYGRGGWSPRDLPMGQTRFLRDNCPVNTCELSMDLKDMESADAIFFKVGLDLAKRHA